MASAPRPAPLDPDELYDTLSNDRRRACIQCLAEHEGEMHTKDIARSVAEATAPDPAEVEESIYISLIQIHLPKLDTYEVVMYDDDEKLVEPSRAFEQTVCCLEEHAQQDATNGGRRLTRVAFAVSLLVLAASFYAGGVTSLLVVVAMLLQVVGLVGTIDESLPVVVSNKRSGQAS